MNNYIEEELINLRLNNTKYNDKRIKELEKEICSINNSYYEEELNKLGYKLICGTDEAGRGPLVGPVVAGAVILPQNYKLEGLTDSKKLSEKKRDYYFDIINRDAIAVGVGIVDASTIDEINILEASRLAMNRAIDNLKVKPDYILTDAIELKKDVKFMPIIHGDAYSISIAAGSIIAKVTRDRIMNEYSNKYPMYEISKHKGYPTKRHLELIKKYGITKEYRKTYKPVRDIIEGGVSEN